VVRRIVIGCGIATMAFGVWLLVRTHAQVGSCNVVNTASPGTHVGSGTSCVQTLMAYSEGFVFVAAGFLLAVIAFTLIARGTRLSRHSVLRSVPRGWGKEEYEITTLANGTCVEKLRRRSVVTRT